VKLPQPILDAKAEVLRQIRDSRPKWNEALQAYVCVHCGSSGDAGFAVWHDVRRCRHCGLPACNCNDYDASKRCCGSCRGGH
jgi:hypothetical protein